VKRIAETLGVARSNLVERTGGRRPQRGPQTRAGDAELTSDIRRLVDSRPSYGYRRIAALLKRERRSAGHGPVNAKRVYRLMKKSGLLLARHTGRRIPRAHDGTIMTNHSNERCCVGVRTRWSSPAGMARSCGLPLPWTAMTARSLAGSPQRLASPAR